MHESGANTTKEIKPYFICKKSKSVYCITEQIFLLESGKRQLHFLKDLNINVLASNAWMWANTHDPQREFLWRTYTHVNTHTHTLSAGGISVVDTHHRHSWALQAWRDSDKEFFLSSARQSNMAAGSDSTSLLPSHGLKLLAQQSESVRVWKESSFRPLI